MTLIAMLFTLGAVAIVAGELTGKDVLEKAMKRYRGDDSILTVILTKAKMDNPSDKKSFEITTYRQSRPEMIKALVAIKKAGDTTSKPILFLVWDWADKNREDQLWYCLPSLGKYNKISSEIGEQKTEQFGFSIEEMKVKDLDRATHTLEGLVDFEGERCYKVVSTPKQPEAEGFSKLVSFIRPDSWTAAKLEYTGLDGKPLKILRVTKIQKVDGIWTEMSGSHENYKKRTVVNFEVKRIEYNKKLSSDLFSFNAPPKEILEGK
jgi:hypothetical protein